MNKLLCLLVFYATLNCSAYAPTGKPTASGIYPQVGHCAVDRINGQAIPFGTRITLPDGQVLIVADRFGGNYNNHLDIFMANESACWQFGRRWLRCRIEIP